MILIGFALLAKIVYEYYGTEGIPLIQTVVVAIGGFVLIVVLGISLSFSRHLESISDYIFSIALVAAGFAFAENIKYMLDIFNNG